LLVHDYDEAIAFFTQAMRWQLTGDTPLTPEKRWVTVAPEAGGAGLLLARAATPAQQAEVGRQAGGRVAFFVHTDRFDDDLAHFAAHGVRLTETPRHEPFGRVVVFLDLYGNRWDLIERPARAVSRPA
jgi:predicted enzyme related to lactoylglutathione lyase